MIGKILLNIGVVILFIIGFFLICSGVVNLIGTLSPNANPIYLRNALGFGAAGLVLLGCSVGLMLAATSRRELKTSQEVTLKIDLPGKTEFSQFTCRNCGGALKPENIKATGGISMVECPFCGTTYQLTEEPVW